jgi:hypothetical protein
MEATAAVLQLRVEWSSILQRIDDLLHEASRYSMHATLLLVVL